MCVKLIKTLKFLLEIYISSQAQGVFSFAPLINNIPDKEFYSHCDTKNTRSISWEILKLLKISLSLFSFKFVSQIIVIEYS